jgi:hypothetical protein
MNKDRKKLVDKFNDFTRNPGSAPPSVQCAVIEVGFLNIMFQEPEVTTGLLAFLNEFHDKPAGEGALCACCNNEFLFTERDWGTWPDKFMLTIPNGAKARDIGITVLTVSLVCKECKPLSNEEIVRRSAKYMGPSPDSWKMV